MKSDNLVTDHVVASDNVRGDGHARGEIVGHELVAAPVSGCGATVDEADSINLEEVELLLGEASELARDSGHVGDDGTVVAFWPGVLGKQ